MQNPTVEYTESLLEYIKLNIFIEVRMAANQPPTRDSFARLGELELRLMELSST